MDQFEKKDRAAGIASTVGIHLLALLLFLFVGMKEPEPPLEQKRQPIRVILGVSNTGSGNPTPLDEGQPEEMVETQEVVQESNPTETQNIETQNTQETQAVTTSENPTEQTAPAEPQLSEHMQHLLDKFKNKEKAGGSQGPNDEPGKMGRPDGNPDGAWEGGPIGTPWGNYTLGGREVLSVPKVVDDSQDEGIVVVDIIVDKKGNVLRATPGAKGSNINSTILKSKAKKAALEAKFSPNPNAPSEQKGTMTFIFVLE